jgi:hypothetical protein
VSRPAGQRTPNRWTRRFFLGKPLRLMWDYVDAHFSYFAWVALVLAWIGLSWGLGRVHRRKRERRAAAVQGFPVMPVRPLVTPFGPGQDGGHACLVIGPDTVVDSWGPPPVVPMWPATPLPPQEA